MSEHQTGDVFWGQDFAQLFVTDRLVEFFPTQVQTLPERMNAISRFVLYMGVILSVYKSDLRCLYLSLFLLMVLYLFMRYETVDKQQISHFGDYSSEYSLPVENYNGCTLPTATNPFMNRLLLSDPNRPAACKGPEIQAEAVKFLNGQVVDDVYDLYNNKNNQRIFNTMPSTDLIPNTEKFVNWLNKGYKNQARQNVLYEDPRYRRKDTDLDMDIVAPNIL